MGSQEKVNIADLLESPDWLRQAPQPEATGTADSAADLLAKPRWLEPTPRRRRRWPLALALLALLALVCAVLVWLEIETSYLQSTQIPPYARGLDYEVGKGATDRAYYPTHGPFDQRLGYTRLPDLLPRLQQAGFRIDRQARFSPQLLDYVRAGLNPPYRELSGAGLTVLDRDGEPYHRFHYPRRMFADFRDIAPLMVSALLFIEDRHLLDADHEQLNPAVNWARFFKAALFKVGDAINLDTPSMGGSTLATQIEKFRHSPHGVTGSVEEKMRQIISASIRVYHQGPATMPARQRLVLDYLNTVPLSAAPGVGEVHGIGDGLYVWLGADVGEVNRLLKLANPEGPELQAQGQALRQVMALMIAHRRPSHYLFAGKSELAALTEAHLRVLTRNGIISESLQAAANSATLNFRNFREHPAVIPNDKDKGTLMSRSRLASLLGVSIYDLDRLHLTATTTLDRPLQVSVTEHLRKLLDPEFAAGQGLIGDSLLQADQTGQLRYSFTLLEHTGAGERVLVQTDNTDIPFDINAGSKLELGSTAKLRVLASYLGIIAEVYQKAERGELAPGDEPDPLSRWVQGQLRTQPDMSLEAMLAAAMERRYSADTSEAFLTGGGQHTFANFKRQDRFRNPTTLESIRESINLPFVRMLRDVISYLSHTQWQDRQGVMTNDEDPRRQAVLERFIDRESRVYLTRFWRKYADLSREQRLEGLLKGLKLTPVRAAVIHRYIFPLASGQELGAFLQEWVPDQATGEERAAELYEEYGPGHFNLADTGYLARVHPLQLWLMAYLMRTEQPTLAQAMEISAEERREVYQWLVRTRHRNARDVRIRTMLEVEAFSELHRRWQQLGYPFGYLVPSLATALGSSGDRPAALAELMGIILNDGRRGTVQRITKLEFAAGTPYETSLSSSPVAAEQVMEPAVARTLRQALAEVVSNGTGRRLSGVFHDAQGEPLAVGGKTGTGDNRLVVSGVAKSDARALSRTATLVFYLGERHYGTITAYVAGSAASQFRFTSALPAQVLNGMAPLLEPYLAGGELPTLASRR